MHLILPFLCLSVVILQQTARVQSLESPAHSVDNDASRTNDDGRLRAPLMAHSLSRLPAVNDDKDSNRHEPDSDSRTDEDALLLLEKRRSGMPLFGRRGLPSKRRGPLFG